MLKRLIILFLLLIYGCSENPLESDSYLYEMKITTNMNCQHLYDNWYEIILDSNYIQTFIEVKLKTSDDRVNHVNWEWQSSDTSHYYLNGNDYGIIPPTNQSSVIMNSVGKGVFGFHRMMVADTIGIYGVFIDSKLLLNSYDIQEVYFIVRL